MVRGRQVITKSGRTFIFRRQDDARKQIARLNRGEQITAGQQVGGRPHIKGQREIIATSFNVEIDGGRVTAKGLERLQKALAQKAPKPTQLEKELGMSLPRGIRDVTRQEFQARQTLPRVKDIEQIRQQSLPRDLMTPAPEEVVRQQTIAKGKDLERIERLARQAQPPASPTSIEERLKISLPREEAERLLREELSELQAKTPQGFQGAFPFQELVRGSATQLGLSELTGESVLLRQRDIRAELGEPVSPLQDLALEAATQAPLGFGIGAGLRVLGAAGTIIGLTGTALATPEIVRGLADPTTRVRTVGGLIGFGGGASRGSKVTPPELISLIKARVYKFKGINEVNGKLIVDLTTKKGKEFALELLPRGLDKIKVGLQKQLEQAGTTTTVVSAAKNFFKTLQRKEEVGRTIPKDQPPLKRVLYADPQGRLRTSRLQLDDIPEASFRDVLSGNVVLSNPKRQALVFEDIKIADLSPRLRNLFEKAIKGDNKAAIQFQKEFLKKQLEVTGEFQPIGFLSSEPEVTLAPNTIVKKAGTLGNIIIKGKPVEIIQAEIIKPTPRTNELLKKFNEKDVSKIELNELKRRVKSESGLDFETAIGSSKSIASKPIAPIVALSVPSVSDASLIPDLVSRINKVSRKEVIRNLQSPNQISTQSNLIQTSPTTRSPQVPITQTSPISQQGGFSSFLGSGISQPPRIPTTTPPPSPPPTRTRTEEEILTSALDKLGRTKAFKLFVKRKGKFKRVNGNKLFTRGEALKRGTEITQSTLAATFKIEEAGTTLDRPNRQFKVPDTFRTFKIQGGKTIPLKDTFIEKRQFRLSRRPEVREIQTAKKQANTFFGGGFI